MPVMPGHYLDLVIPAISRCRLGIGRFEVFSDLFKIYREFLALN